MLKRSIDEILTMAERHRLESYLIKYCEQLPSEFDTLYTAKKFDTCNQRHREKKKLMKLQTKHVKKKY